MSSAHYASIAARVLRRVPPPTPPGAAAAAAAAQGLLTIQRALSARRRRQQWLRGVAVGSAVAATLALSFGLHKLSSSSSASNGSSPGVSVSVVHGSGASVVDGAQHRARLHVGAAVAAGSRIETTPDGEAVLHFSTGTEVALDARSVLTLQDRGSMQRFVLQAGGLSASVAKLGDGARFVIETPDAEVEVRGTRFHVTVLDRTEPCAAARTRLLVLEGTVEVRSGGRAALVRAGQHWPEACGTAEEAAQPVESHAARAAKVEGRRAEPSARLAVEAPAARAPVTAAPEPHRSELTAQTELFAEASRAASRGEVAAALSKFQALAQAYPASALAENAIVERMRLLKGALARREAEHYLRLYPGGFGKAEAERTLAAP